MLPIRWNAAALDELEAIIGYIASLNPAAAKALKQRIQLVVLRLSQRPYLYRSGRVPGTRELLAHPNYIIVYRVRPGHVEITNVLHARQKYP